MIFPERFRAKLAGTKFLSLPGDPFGVFMVPAHHALGRVLRIIATDGKATGWEHVSVSLEAENKTPTWAEMCLVKDLFWEPQACVVQFHPAKSDYINQHPGCLHLWRLANQPFPTPPLICV